MFMRPCDEYPLFYPNIRQKTNIIGFIHAASTHSFTQSPLQSIVQEVWQYRYLQINRNTSTVTLLHITDTSSFANNISSLTRRIDAFHVVYRCKEGCTLGRQHGLKNSCRRYQLRSASGIRVTPKTSSAHLTVDARQSAIY